MNHSILFGNGLNLITKENPSWIDLLNSINNKAANRKNLPYTIIYEYMYLCKAQEAHPSKKDVELTIKKEIAERLIEIKTNEIYERIKSLPARNFITTNYDYAFCEQFKKPVIEENSEEIYSIRRHKEYDCGTKLWFIHGEIGKPKSIMLGLDHYCGSIGKIDSYLKGTYQKKETKHILKKLEAKEFDSTSWIELFFNSNLHIIGFGLSYIESDIWWLLHKRSRLAKQKILNNKIFFYTTDSDPEKFDLLQRLDIEITYRKPNNEDHTSAYKELIDQMEENMMDVKQTMAQPYLSTSLTIKNTLNQ